jgi:hypothetical protein
MMKRLLCLALVIYAAPLARGADMENPYKKSKVGDWAEYKMTTTAMGINIDGTIKQTVDAKDDKEATIKVTGEMSFMGNKMAIPEQKQKIDLTKPYDPSSAANLPKGTEATVEKDGEGKEKIKVGGKEYDCTWQKMKVKTKVGGMDFDSDIKVWTSKDVPLGGMVKMEMKSKLADMTMELTGTGAKK